MRRDSRRLPDRLFRFASVKLSVVAFAVIEYGCFPTAARGCKVL